MPSDPLATPAVRPVAHYLAEPHTELVGCYQIARYSPHRPTQRIGNYTSHDTAQEIALFLNRHVGKEAT
jgi:hypothetical protein